MTDRNLARRVTQTAEDIDALILAELKDADLAALVRLHNAARELIIHAHKALGKPSPAPRTREIWPAQAGGQKIAYVTEADLTALHEVARYGQLRRGLTLDASWEIIRRAILAVKPELAVREPAQKEN